MTSLEVSEVEVRRSARRRRTVTAFRENGRVVVCVPARLSHAEERRWIATMVERVESQEQRRRPSDDELMSRALDLSERYLGGEATPTSVRWSSAQKMRWGSCTPSDGSVRLSTRLRGVPTWVVDYVLVHELAHLIESGHNDRFWELVSQYPKTERARGFLDGVSHARAEGTAATEPDE